MNIHKIISIVESSPKLREIFRFCPYEILNKFEVKSFKSGQIIFEQGEVYDCFCLITKGLADIYITIENGKRYSQAIYSEADFIGELELFEVRPFVCSVAALTDMELLVLDRKSFLLWVELDKNFNHYLMRLMSKQFYKLSKKAGDDNLYSLKYRVCDYLISCVDDQERKSEKIILNIMKNQLSERFAVTERSINRVLKSLKEKQIIEINSRNIIVKDIQKLKKELKAERLEK
jgi:CRP-like cAMP-binding protein